MYRSWILAFLVTAQSAQAQVRGPAHDGGQLSPATARQAARWEPGTFLESIAIAPDGTAFVANHEAGTVDRVRGDTVERFAKLPGAVTGILRRPDGGFLATGREKGGSESVYAVSSRGSVATLATLPRAGFLNGLAWLNDRTVLVADSDAGVIWSVDVASGRAEPWARDALLDHADPATHFPANTGFPAANGVKRRGDAVYVSNSGRGVILRIPVVSGDRAGKAEVWARDIVADDFAFDAAGDAYVPTHPKQSVVRLQADGTRTTIATPAQGIAGPTALTFGPDGGLYVVGNSGIPIDGVRRPATLVRLDVSGAATPAAIRQVTSPIYMMVTAPTIGGSDDRRKTQGQAYLRFLESHLDQIAFGGQVKATGGEVVERVYFVQAATPEEARRLMEGSPYFKSRVYGPLTARPLQGMLGGFIGGVAWPPPQR
jgi:sugar lactone lactonase YvrE